MKKILLSSFVVFSFLAYAINNRENTNSAKINSEISISTSPTPTLSASPTDQKPISPQPTPKPTPIPTPTPLAQGQYKNGEYTGNVADAYYGNVQVKAIIQNGRIADVQFLQYPNDRQTSQRINEQATPYLTQEAIQAQSANVDTVSGATQTSRAFIESLSSALSQAVN